MSLQLLEKFTCMGCARNVFSPRLRIHRGLPGLHVWVQKKFLHHLSQMTSPKTSLHLSCTISTSSPIQMEDEFKSFKAKTSHKKNHLLAARVNVDRGFLDTDISGIQNVLSKRFHTSANQNKKKKHVKNRDNTRNDEVSDSEVGSEVDFCREDLIQDETNRDLAEQLSLPGEESDWAGEASLEALVETISGKLASQGRQLKPPSPSQLQVQVEHFLQHGFSPSLVVYLLSRRPDLATTQRWHPLLADMLLHGLTPRRVTQMLVSMANLTQVSVRQFRAMVQCLRGVGLADAELLRLLSQCPTILGLSPRHLVGRVTWLREVFKTKDVLRLLSSCPSLLFEDMARVEEKFDYAFYVMGVSQRQMMHSRLFTYDLAHLHARHAFVERAGFFSSARRREGERNTNPRLDHVIDTTDKAFARRFGNMTAEEYAAFKALFEMEVAEKKRREEEGSSDEEDDDE